MAEGHRSMRICFISSEYPPETPYGGIAAYTQTLAGALAKAGHDVHVIAASPFRESDSVESGVGVHRIKKLHGLSRWLPYRFEVLHRAKGLGPMDVIEAPDFNAEGVGIAIFGKLFGGHSNFVTRLHTPSSVLSRIYYGGPVGGLTSLEWRAVYSAEVLQLRSSDSIHSPTAIAAKIISRALNIPVREIEVIPNGVDVEAFRKFEEVDDVGVEGDFILYFGRLEPRKGLHILTEALPLVFRNYPAIRFVFAGRDTPFRGTTMKRWILEATKDYQDRLVFSGYVSEDFKKTLIKKARFIVLPSLSEGFGYSALEAMVMGKPVIATSGTGFEEVIDQNSGFLVKPGDSKALAAQICNCLQSDLGEVAKNAARMATRFDIGSLVGRYEQFYTSQVGI